MRPRCDKRFNETDIQSMGQVANISYDRAPEAEKFLWSRCAHTIPELQAIGNDMDCRSELGHCLSDGLAVGEDDIAPGKDLSIVAFVLCATLRADVGKSTMVIDHVADDEIGVKGVDQPWQVLVRRVSPEDHRPLTKAVTSQRRAHVIDVARTGPQPRTAREGAAIEVCVVARSLRCTRPDCLPRSVLHHQPGLVAVSPGSSVVGVELLRCCRPVEVDDRTNPTRPLEVLG